VNAIHVIQDRAAMTAFRESVEAMIPALRRYARALTRDADIADDLVQDTLVRALRSERLFLGGDVRSWLYTILTNLNKNRRRSLARRPQFMPLLDNNPDASGTEAEGRDIARALATLAEEQRAVLLLVMLEGLRYRDVASCARPRPRQGVARGRAPGVAAGEMMTGIIASDMADMNSGEAITRQRFFLHSPARHVEETTGMISTERQRQ
jgi:RNA polymerase sigma-70 factor, ECF subfamily